MLPSQKSNYKKIEFDFENTAVIKMILNGPIALIPVIPAFTAHPVLFIAINIIAFFVVLPVFLYLVCIVLMWCCNAEHSTRTREPRHSRRAWRQMEII